MPTTRLEAFSDGVIAIIITIMVLEFQAPETADWHGLSALMPALLTYVLSFVYLAIYWNNHHHLMHVTAHVGGGVLWANMHLLFWLSLVPFVTGWMGEHHFAPLPTAVYGVVLLLAAVAYWILVNAIIAHEGPHSKLRAAVGRDVKGRISIAIYAAAIPLAFVNQWISDALYVTVALIWLVPDRRIEKRVRVEHA
ncbi:MAG: TMEM175 family protein [Vicinamibacterales bacterium]